MRIELEKPYSDRWRHGYVVTNPENRKTLILFNSDEDRSSTQYARYLKAVSIGRFLSDDETVDHIDEDKTNDDIDNLGILTRAENIEKSRQARFPDDRSHLRHGTLSMYRYCKCDLCRKAKSDHMKAYNEKRKTKNLLH